MSIFLGCGLISMTTKISNPTPVNRWAGGTCLASPFSPANTAYVSRDERTQNLKTWVMASTRVIVFPVPGGPNTRWGAGFEDPATMRCTAACCSGLFSSWRLNILKSKCGTGLKHADETFWILRVGQTEALNMVTTDQMMISHCILCPCNVSQSHWTLCYVFHKTSFACKPSDSTMTHI